MRPRVLFVSPTAEWIGATNSLLTVIRYLRGPFDVTVAAPGEGLFSERLKREGIPFIRLQSLTRWGIPELIGLIRREGFDLVYANNASGSSRNAVIAARLAGVRALCHVRSMVGGKGWLQFVYLNLADSVIAISRASADALRGRVLRRKIRIVHNAVDVGRFGAVSAEERRRLRDRLNLDENRPVAIYVAHLKPRKSQDFALRALERCVRAESDLVLLLVGALDRDPEYVSGVRRYIGDHDLGEHVRLTGFRQDVPKLLSIADFAIHTAGEEAFGRSVIEAMAAGLPVVAAAVDGVAEIVNHGETGYLVPPGNVDEFAERMIRLARDPELRRELGERAGRRAAERFAPETAARRIGMIIAEHLDRPVPDLFGRPGAPA